MSDSGDDELDELDECADRVGVELMRIFGDHLEATPPGFVLLPLVSGAEAVAFLSTVPAGTTLAELSLMANEYRATHPLTVSADDDEGEPPGAAV